MKILKNYFLAALVFCLGSLSAQTFIGEINPFPKQPVDSHRSEVRNRNAVDTIKILAVLVEFQKDTDANTGGDGTFNSIYGKEYGDKIIDPLPHDVNYFSNHLEFAKNYFAKVSNGKANVVYQFLPQVVTVSKTMRNYSPPVNSTDFTAMAEFMKEVWLLAGNQNPNFNFNDFNLFAIFHAGVGRDISLPGSLGNEKDLPSVYLGLNALQKYFGTTFTGIQVGNANSKVTNSMILPQTENREITSFGQTSLFQVSINGLIAANIASYLGLPDLFDTNTGLSAIGKFGLMDGQAIFANRGLFPPEPSAWEKIFLGWEIPFEIEVKAGSATYIINPSLDALHKIYKIPINASEYYLVEYRQRDVNKDGLKISLKQNNVVVTKTFALNEYAYFEAIPETLLAGVTTSVDEHDFSLPGSGILIWHIDEKIISEKITDNKINSDKTRRGVDVEEADGVQDIGEQFTTIFGDKVVGEGWESDLWYKTNSAKLYQNKFSSDTRPNTNANDGANSLITFQNFSDLTNPLQMTFDLQFSGDVVKPIFKKAIALPSTDNKLTSINFNGKNYFFVLSNSNLYQFDEKGNLVDSVLSFSSFKPAVFVENDLLYVVGLFNSTNLVNSSSINILTFSATERHYASNSFSFIASTPPVCWQKSKFIFGTTLDGIHLISVNADSILNHSKFVTDYVGTAIKIASPSVAPLPIRPDRLDFITKQKYYTYIIWDSLNFVENLHDLVQSKTSSGVSFFVVLSEEKFYVINDKAKIISEFSVNGSPTSFSLADLKQDGSNYILYTNGTNLEAYNLSGASAENFPFHDPMGIGFTGTPLAADIQGDGKSEVIAVTTDGRIFAVDGGTGKVVNGFPISTGQSLSSTPILFSDSGKVSLAVLNENSFSAFNICGTGGKYFWSEENGNSWNNSFVDKAANTNSISEFFPKAKAYNWPNPVYDGQTFIRYYVSEDSKINIKIFDLAGDFVAELNNTAIGGMDNETTWNVNNIQSGVYFARVEATGNSGKSESTIIKIAIVK
ncbi:MAG: T9SS type A sorting domain-containing protein [Ignavibacteriaceae bacterium]|nr:T9SS type A sorting domain-containing protein [Ignavibacteriaceae bacterium]